jgi:exodeoxyribonuclease-5
MAEDHIILEGEQKDAAKKILEWFYRGTKQYFILRGSAGTGKSSLLRYIRSELGLNPSEVVYITYTGKAAMVMKRKGMPATSMHKFMYVPEYDGMASIVQMCPECKQQHMIVLGDIAICEACGYEMDYILAADQLDKVKKKKTLIFRKRTKDEIPNTIKLIIVDEASMINQKYLDDLLSYNISILLSGDHKQLPPIHGESVINDQGDFTLETIHRNAGGIVQVAHMMIKGQKLNYGQYGKNVWVLDPDEVSINLILKANQVLCGKNDTRRDITQEIREAKGFGPLLTTGDKVMCIRNNWKKGIVNGQMGIATVGGNFGSEDIFDCFGMSFNKKDNDLLKALVNSTQNNKTGSLTIGFTDEDGSSYPYLEIDEAVLYETKEPEMKGRLEFFQFADCITTHKSQGSEFDKVVLFEEQFMAREKHLRLMYTGITRAKQQLIILKERK